MTNERIKVAIADDQPIYREGLHLVLSKDARFEVVGEAQNGQELLQLVAQSRPDVVLMDILMPVIDGIAATRQLKERYPDIKVVALSMYEDYATIMDMVHAGAYGYLVKNADSEEIYQAIESVYSEKPFYCNTSSHELTKMMARIHKRELEEGFRLTDKEVRVMVAVCDELKNKDIAELMYTSKRTVDGYRARLMEKLNLHTAVAVVKYAIKHGIYKV